MAAQETIHSIHGQYMGYDGHDDFDNERPAAAMPTAYFPGDANVISFCTARQRMSRLFLESEGDDADAETSEEDEESKGGGGGALLDGSDKESSFGMGVVSIPGTPDWGPSGGTEWLKEYASETEGRGGGGGGARRPHHHWRNRRTMERWLERSWQMKKSHAAAEYGSEAAAELRVVVRPRCGSGRMCMDIEEVRACRDLGLDLPSDWMVEIPETFSDLAADTSSGGNSPIGICSSGDDPRDVKAKLKVWAQAVALTSASRLSG